MHLIAHGNGIDLIKIASTLRVREKSEWLNINNLHIYICERRKNEKNIFNNFLSHTMYYNVNYRNSCIFMSQNISIRLYLLKTCFFFFIFFFYKSFLIFPFSSFLCASSSMQQQQHKIINSHLHTFFFCMRLASFFFGVLKINIYLFSVMKWNSTFFTMSSDFKFH